MHLCLASLNHALILSCVFSILELIMQGISYPCKAVAQVYNPNHCDLTTYMTHRQSLTDQLFLVFDESVLVFRIGSLTSSCCTF